jgi:nucleoside-diphosphate-sugar epimerase
MRIFVTGATGFVGSAIVRELLAAGHQVLGLARGDAGADALAAMGATVARGSLEDLESLRRGAEAADAVIHTAFIHEFANFAHSCAVDQRAITTIGEVLAGSQRPFAVTTGTPILPGRVATEDDAGERTNPIAALRAPAEDLTLALAERGVRVSIVRLPRSVHGAGEREWRGGLVTPMIELARAKGRSAYIGDGAQRWPAVHRLDAARLYRLAIERAPAGSRLHAIAEEGVTVREIATSLGRRLGVPVASIAHDDAAAHFGLFGASVGTDQPATSTRTRALVGWEPTGPGLLADLDTCDL